MYTSHFEFKAEPFQISTDPRFLWLGEQHKEALAILEYGIQENKGVIALSGGVGTGKTTLINALMDRIKDDVIAVVVSDPGLEAMDFFYHLANLYGITYKENSKADFLLHFVAFLKNATLQKKKVLLIIDEAQRLTAKMLEEIRLLSNIEYVGERLLNVFLVGQNELNAMLIKPENRSLKQRIAIQYNIVPLTLNDVHVYIEYRLGVVGSERRIFTDAAINEIFAFSKGYPRLINVICDQSLITAFVLNSREVTADMVASTAQEFQFAHQAPSAQPISTDVVKTRTAKMIAPPTVLSNPFKGIKRNRSIFGDVKNLFSSFRFAYIGLSLAFVIFSGYLVYQYTMGSTLLGTEPEKGGGQKHKIAHSSSPAGRPGTRTTGADEPPIIEETSRRSSFLTGRVIMPIKSLRTPRSKHAEKDLTVKSTDPSKPETDPSEIYSGGNEDADSPAADADTSPMSDDKDPGAIIDWLIQKKK